MKVKTIVYFVDTSALEDSEKFNKYFSEMPKYRQEKIEKYKFDKDKRLSLGVGMLLNIAKKDFKVADTGVEFEENGKPFFNNSFKFNLSHSGSVAMCIASVYEVGCDVEKIRAGVLDIADRYYNPSEREYINLAPEKEKLNTFFRLWTLKESFMKVTGLGFSLPLCEFSIELDRGKVIQSVDNSNYDFYEIDVFDGYKSSVCIKNAEEKEKLDIRVIDLWEK